jgi:hypothetical protein
VRQADPDGSADLRRAQGREDAVGARVGEGADALVGQVRHGVGGLDAVDGEGHRRDPAHGVADEHHLGELAQPVGQVGQQTRLVGLHRAQRGQQPFPARPDGRVVETGEVVHGRDQAREQRQRVRPHLQALRSPGAVVERHRRQVVEHRRVAEGQRTHLRTAPRRSVDGDHVGAHLGDVQRDERRGAGGVDDQQRVVLVSGLRGRADVRAGADRARSGRDRHDLRARRDQVAVLPGRQLAGLDVDLGPAHGGPGALGGALPRVDVVGRVQPGDDDVVADHPAVAQGVGEPAEQHGRIRPEHHPGGLGTHEIRDRATSCLHDRLGALRSGEVPARTGNRCPQGGGRRRGHLLGNLHACRGVQVHPPVAERREESANRRDVERHDSDITETPSSAASRVADTASLASRRPSAAGESARPVPRPRGTLEPWQP